MPSTPTRLLARIALCALGVGCGLAGQASALEIKKADESSALYVDGGIAAGVATRRGRNSTATFGVMPYAAVGYGDRFHLDTRNGGHAELGQFGPFGFGPAVTLDRYQTTPPGRPSAITDMFGQARAGAFLNYREAGLEWGRLTVTTGIGGSGATGGFDIRATKRFGLTDGLSVNFGPTLSYGDAQRYGVPSNLTWSQPLASGDRLAATGAALELRKDLGSNVTATVSANYAYVHSVPGSTNVLPGGRNRFDIGLTLSTRLLGQ